MRLPPTERECARIRSTWRDCTSKRRGRSALAAARLFWRLPVAPLLGPTVGVTGTALILAGMAWAGVALVGAGLAIAFGCLLGAEVADMRRRRWAGRI